MSSVVDGWVNRPRYDYVAIVLVFVVGLKLGPHGVPEPALLGTWYQTLASISGVMLGFSSVAITVVFAVAPTQRLEVVYDSVGPKMVRLMLASLAGVAWSTAGFVALFLVPSRNVGLRNAFTAALVVLLVLRFGRLWWMLEKVMSALMVDRKDLTESAGQESWVEPVVGAEDYSTKSRRPRRR